MIVRNSAKCLDCGDEIESTHRHDFRSCSCGNIFVDGGRAYMRRGARNDNWEDTSIVQAEPVCCCVGGPHGGYTCEACR